MSCRWIPDVCREKFPFVYIPSGPRGKEPASSVLSKNKRPRPGNGRITAELTPCIVIRETFVFLCVSPVTFYFFIYCTLLRRFVFWRRRRGDCLTKGSVLYGIPSGADGRNITWSQRSNWKHKEDKIYLFRWIFRVPCDYWTHRNAWITRGGEGRRRSETILEPIFKTK